MECQPPASPNRPPAALQTKTMTNASEQNNTVPLGGPVKRSSSLPMYSNQFQQVYLYTDHTHTVFSTHLQILTKLSHPPDTKRLMGLWVCVWPMSEPGCRYGPQLTALQPIYTQDTQTHNSHLHVAARLSRHSVINFIRSACAIVHIINIHFCFYAGTVWVWLN